MPILVPSPDHSVTVFHSPFSYCSVTVVRMLFWLGSRVLLGPCTGAQGNSKWTENPYALWHSRATPYFNIQQDGSCLIGESHLSLVLLGRPFYSLLTLLLPPSMCFHHSPLPYLCNLWTINPSLYGMEETFLKVWRYWRVIIAQSRK